MVHMLVITTLGRWRQVEAASKVGLGYNEASLNCRRL